MGSFDVVSVFTNAPLGFTVGIGCDAVYSGDVRSPVTIEETCFRHLMSIVTSWVEFRWGIVFYQQVDGVGMGSLLGPFLAC